MPTPTVFQNGQTEHSNIVVEGVIVQRAFFSNPPSECGSDSDAPIDVKQKDKTKRWTRHHQK